ncbi:Lecithin:cholesterol/phospholipid:diacylglycerol acyltransferase [Kalmanozyma brasiliensis GHG001]|uniref:Putative LRO1-a lecithin cholesterol acyltransferase-like protein n=1 Tax=Kalmanozyma brasiliensis (strain GHG001) TaxID=1365824 RepID=V5GVL1_KALBG|nr:Lecithin:cholesterol/phospholipid:diacylglycerol acyltransferase [Kalmanozyma brasiliensis GHG001]EST09937.1 Lecithin:cholesterol/phospholipid:diacylglycerol acyltransferase [Kalmanozyma brasiliensis GHG001]
MNNRKHKKGGGGSNDPNQNGNSSAHQLNQRSNGGQASSSSSDSKNGRSTPPQQIILQRSKRPSLKGQTSYSVTAPGTPWHELDLSEIPFLRHEAVEEPIKRGLMRYRRLFFVFGAALGAVIAFLASRNLQMAQHMASLRSIVDESIDGLDFPSIDIGIPKEFADMGENIFSRSRGWFKNKDFGVGRDLSDSGYSADHPVILIPGIVSTGLESWTTDRSSAGYFRKRLWGTTTMMRTIVLQKEMWVRHLSLDPDTGLDPPGIRVRAAEGLDAASFFAAGYWIWSKVIENLAVLGYDTNNLFLASYDWRLSYYNLEVRDRFFTRLKLKIEQNKALFGKKTVIVAHSMGSSVFFYFMKWAEAEGEFYGNGGPNWVEDHIEAFSSIAGTFLGVPKAMAVMLSGEMRDTVEVPPAAAYLLEKFFSRRERAKLFRTWAGGASMLIKGGEDIWGNSTWAPDDEHGAEDTHGHIYSFRQPSADQHDLNEETVRTNLTATEAHNWMLQHAPSSFQKMLATNYSHGIERDADSLARNDADHTKWSNPLEATLPHAPSMKLYCIYGVGKPTERSYWYQQGEYVTEASIGEQMDEPGIFGQNHSDVSRTPPLDFPTARLSWIDHVVQKEDALPKVRAGCKMGDGDGTVSLLSLGAMCAEGWKHPHWNPANISVVTHELKHEPEAMDLRGGESTGDHVDILGARGVNEAILKIAAGRGEEVGNQYFSEIRRFASRVKWLGTTPGP